MQPTASPTSINGSSQRPVFRMRPALHPSSIDKRKGRQNKPPQSSNSFSQSSPTHQLAPPGGAIPRPTAMTATISSPSSTSANYTQQPRDKATTAKATQKPTIITKPTLASKMAIKGLTAKNRIVISNSTITKALPESLPQSSNAPPVTTSVVFPPTPSTTGNQTVLHKPRDTSLGSVVAPKQVEAKVPQTTQEVLSSEAPVAQKESPVTFARPISNVPYRASKKVVMKKTTDRAPKNSRQSTSRARLILCSTY